MRNSKLFLVLKEFDKYEQNRCRKYVQSPYFNRSETIAQLYDLIIAETESKKKKETPKEKMWDKLHSGKNFNDVRWRKYCSDLMKLVEGYLAQEEYEQDTPKKIAYLMDAISYRKDWESIKKNVIKKSEDFLAEKETKNQEEFYNTYLLEKKKYELHQAERQRTAVSNVEKIINGLDDFYISEKLKLYCDTLSRKTTVSYSYQVKLIDQILDYLKNENKKNLPPVIEIYFKIILTISEFENEEHYYSLKAILEKFASSFSKKEASEMYSFVVNYCTRKINKGKKEFYREYFEIHKQLLKTKVIIVNNELNVGIFKNLVTIGLRLGEAEWIETFIREYQIYLPQSQRENAVTYNMAALYHHQKKYDQVKSLLQEVEYEDFIYNLNAKRLLMITYFETDEQEPLFSLIDSWRAYLYRNPNISNDMRESYTNLLTMTRKLARIGERDKEALRSIKKEIHKIEKLGGRSWLLEKIAERE